MFKLYYVIKAISRKGYMSRGEISLFEYIRVYMIEKYGK